MIMKGNHFIFFLWEFNQGKKSEIGRRKFIYKVHPLKAGSDAYF